jgi:hypothetical protein
MKKLSDLRFVIGIFFTIIGLLLIAWCVAGPGGRAMDSEINWRAGFGFFVFGGLMVFLSFRNSISEK